MESRIRDTIRRVDDAISAHRAGLTAPLSLKLLTNVRGDLENMLRSIDGRAYLPIYPRFLIDWPDDDAFVKELVTLAYDYKRGWPQSK